MDKKRNHTNKFQFVVDATDWSAHAGKLSTPHGVVETPAFVPVGTQATVKSLSPDDLENVNTQLVLANTYHLYLQPGPEAINRLGGLHQMMRWDKPLMTDSGGFQVFSLGWALEHDVGKLVSIFADDSREEVSVREYEKKGKALIKREKLCVVDDEGATFRSHLDGTLHRWTAEKSMDVQHILGADLVFALDECTSPVHDEAYTRLSMKRSHLWEERSLVRFKELNKKSEQSIYSIVQGGPFEKLRKKSAQFVAGKDFFGTGIGGALVSKSKMGEILDWIMPIVPENRPNHLLGIGDVDDVFLGVDKGIDTFDCAFPTRIARRGDLLMMPEDGGTCANHWRLHITRHEFRDDPAPICRSCHCELCQSTYSRGYINHLFWARELLAYRLATIHNLWVMNMLFTEIREGIASHSLNRVRERWMG